MCAGGNHEIRAAAFFRIRRLAGAIRAEFLGRHAGAAEHPGALHERRSADHGDRIAAGFPTRLEQKRNVEHDQRHTAPARGGKEALLPGVDARVENSFELLERRRIAEHPPSERRAIDPESQIMKTSSEGFQQCYNAQMAVDGEHQIIVATQVGPQASDQGQLVGMLAEINETFGVEPAVVLADAGYCNEPDLLELEDRGIDAHVALGREGKSQVAVDPARLPATHRMGEKLASPAGKARYAQRKWLSEAPNGWIKEVLGFRRFSLRGLAKVRGEWDLVCLALNIKRMGTVATC